jgi:hypothetical protein
MFELTPTETRVLAETIVADSDRTEVHATWENSPGWIRRKGRATWRYNNRHLTTTVVVDALDGRNAGFGTYFGNEQGTVKRILFDVDKHERETHEAETDRFDLQSTLGRFGVPYLIARSKSGQGYHLEIRFTNPVSTSKARRFGKVLLG